MPVRNMHFSLFSVVLAASAAYAATACNGDPRLCDRRYSNVTQIGAHDSAFVGTTLVDNQYKSVSTQLDAGIRFLQGQTHKNFLGSFDLCHTSCFLRDAGPVVNFLTTIKDWLDANPCQVVTLLLTNGDNLPLSLFSGAMMKSGLAGYAYAPGNNIAMDAWPTLQELIDDGHRLVMFLDTGADTSTVPYILDEFTYFFETPYDTTDPNFPECTLDRPKGGSATGRMYIVNHMLDIQIGPVFVPDAGAIDTTNSAASIEAQSNLCYGTWGRMPNFILVDYVTSGDVLTAQNQLNNLS